DDGRTSDEVGGLLDFDALLLFLLGFLGSLLRGGFAAVFDFQQEAVLLGELDGDGFLDGLVHRGEDAGFHELGDELERLHAERGGEVADDDRRLEVNDLDVALGGDGRGLRRRHRGHDRGAGSGDHGGHHGGLGRVGRRRRRRRGDRGGGGGGGTRRSGRRGDGGRNRRRRGGAGRRRRRSGNRAGRGWAHR